MIFRSVVCALMVLLGGLWFGNSSRLVDVPLVQTPRLIAHRGVHQIYAGTDRGAQTCRAARVHDTGHGFIENTLPSMRAAFAAGADVVELDVHLTPDDVFAVFHDWMLQCQTDGNGVTHKQPFTALRALDVGYGFSRDGETFPLRGTGVALMPSLRDVFGATLDGQVLINFKSRRAKEGTALAEMLRSNDLRRQVFGVYGGAPPTQAALNGTPGLRGLDKSTLKACLLPYIAMGWTGYVPQPCHNTLVGVPLNFAPYLWGWPHLFTQRLQAHGATVILWGPYDGSGFSSGIDDLDTLARVPTQFGGYVWTNRIEVIGPALTQR